ncbi:MAG: bi-domain-containing oxidoreductase, partial [Pseudomonadales bacterium]
IGLGLVGLLVAQLVAAAGSQVVGVDVNKERLAMLARLVPDAELVNSAELDPVETVRGLSGGYGADKVIICAASKDTEIANQAMKMARKQGIVVFVGIVKMHLERMPFFRNELDIRFSRAYGPGVMDPEYEKGNVDYPRQYVRWTQQRNLTEFLRLISVGKVDIKPLIGGVFKVEDAQSAYDKLYDGSLGGISALLEYSDTQELLADNTRTHVSNLHTQSKSDKISIGIIGCGNFTRSTHIPNLHDNEDFQIAAIASSTGVNAVAITKRFEVPYSTTDYQEILDDPNIDAVMIATRHNLHGEIACKALAAGKHVFVEKPAVLNWQQHQALLQARENSDKVYMVGYNRRYSPLAAQLKSLLQEDLQLIVQYQVCVPEIPDDHWTLNPEEGGGRLIGEAEHFFDFINYLAGREATSVSARCLQREIETKETQFNFSVDIDYANKAFGSVTYTSFAAPGSARETITVYQNGQTLVIEDFKKLIVKGKKTKTLRNAFGDMGHKAELKAFAGLVKGEHTMAGTLHPLAASNISLLAMDYLKG